MAIKIYILESLLPNIVQDPQTGRELFEDILPRYSAIYGQGSVTFEYFDISSKQELLDILDSIHTEITDMDECILHFEMHGTATGDTGLGVALKNGDDADWSELETYLIRINYKTQNNLHVIMAACYGAYIGTVINTFRNIAPIRSFTGSSKQMNAKEIRVFNEEFYHTLIHKQDAFEAFKVMNDPVFYTKYIEALFDKYFETVVIPRLVQANKTNTLDEWGLIYQHSYDISFTKPFTVETIIKDVYDHFLRYMIKQNK
ncbi:hypothetical protein [Runella zeae]|uniref:hypothetical protein n=1 Tax=Runella zeae TaxID=94255 RepID=UPI00041AA492|nr:hypothetical protein [Runella zeae]